MHLEKKAFNVPIPISHGNPSSISASFEVWFEALPL